MYKNFAHKFMLAEHHMGFTKGNACKIMFVQRFILREEMKDNIGKNTLQM